MLQVSSPPSLIVQKGKGVFLDELEELANLIGSALPSSFWRIDELGNSRMAEDVVAPAHPIELESERLDERDQIIEGQDSSGC